MGRSRSRSGEQGVACLAWVSHRPPAADRLCGGGEAQGLCPCPHFFLTPIMSPPTVTSRLWYRSVGLGDICGGSPWQPYMGAFVTSQIDCAVVVTSHALVFAAPPHPSAMRTLLCLLGSSSVEASMGRHAS